MAWFGREQPADGSETTASLRGESRRAWPGSVMGLLVGSLLLHFWLAYGLPMTNDEAYYWDWGQAPQLSYYDHPPGVAILTWASSRLWDGTWGARFLSPLVYGAALVLTLLVYRRLAAASGRGAPGHPQGQGNGAGSTIEGSHIVIALATVVPGLSLWGSIALPDTGLMLGVSLMTWVALLLWNRVSLGAKEGALLGVALGLSGLFKYHALPLGGGIALALGARRWLRHGKVDGAFWVVAILVGFSLCLPVWIWNWQHDFASIRFQTAHGFAKPSFHGSWGLRILLAQFLLLGIPLVWRSWRLLARPVSWKPSDDPVALAVWGAAPLLLLLTITSFFKPILPHWTLPIYWLLLPFVVARSAPRWPRWQWVMTGALSGLVLLFSWSGVRDRILRSMQGAPGPLSEITIWQPMAAQLFKEWQEDEAKAWEAGIPGCEGPPQLAGLRWYTAAQLRFHWPGHPKVISLDPHHVSYYDARDGRSFPEGCPVWIVASPKHLDRERLGEMVLIDSEETLTVSGHEREPWLLLRGRFRRVPEVPEKNSSPYP